jgi:hypothetical protein
MERLKYTPDVDIKVHEEGAIKLICKPFQSHENGIPEWVKNSADEYARRDVGPERRVIVLIFCDAKKDRPASISCLDFAGMTSDVIESHFRYWADPDASQQGGTYIGVQGGHGNGGKCYMTQMFSDYSLIHTVAGDKGNRYGVTGGAIRFGYIEDRATGRDFPVTSVKAELDRALRHTGTGLAKLPAAGQRAFSSGTGFTLVTGVGPRDYKPKIPVPRLLEHLVEHTQMVQTLQFCQVYVIADGRAINDGKPLALPAVEPMEGAEEPRVFGIPPFLADPVTGERVSTTADGNCPSGQLTLKTSKVSMRWSKKGQHSIVYTAKGGFIGSVPVTELDIQSTYRDRIYGDCRLDALERFKQNDRSRLAEGPLTRSVERFIAFQIQTYAEEFESRERRKYGQKEKDAISRINEALDKWKNRFLSEMLGGMWGQDTPPPPGSLPAGVPAKLELLLTHPRMGRGVAIRPTLKFLDEEGQRIRPAPFTWVSDDTNVAVVDEDLGIITSCAYGTTTIHAETLDGGLRSNRVSIQVVPIQHIAIIPGTVQVNAGGRQRLEAVCTLAGGRQASDVYLVWTESNTSVARVSAAGLVFGVAPGETEVVAGDDTVMSDYAAKILVAPGQGGGAGKNKGRGFPKVLVSGEIDQDPDTNEHVHFSSDDPPVWQRPQDVERNIWWINSASPLARLYLGSGYGSESREWRMYHLERYIEVIAQIALSYGPDELGPMPQSEWILRWGSKVAEVQAAAVTDLGEFIATGTLPEVT